MQTKQTTKSFKFGVSMEKEFVDEINERCKQLGISRSLYFRKLAEEDIIRAGNMVFKPRDEK